MDLVADINNLCSAGKHFGFADGRVREGRCVWHLLSMDGLEIAYSTMCPTDDCPVCECPGKELELGAQTFLIHFEMQRLSGLRLNTPGRNS